MGCGFRGVFVYRECDELSDMKLNGSQKPPVFVISAEGMKVCEGYAPALYTH